MKPGLISTASAFAAATLGIVTLLVFSLLQDYGPESAIRQFHEAVRENDDQLLASVTFEDMSDPNVQLLKRQVQDLEEQGARYSVYSVDRHPTYVEADVQYQGPGGQQITVVWVVRKDRRIWRVSAIQTGLARLKLNR
jgi:uncharacterized UPF0160 family protein